MNLINRTMSYDKNQCNCVECTNVKSENQTVEYSPLTEEEIEEIIKERYDYKDEKTKTFIRKALRKHGNIYDYSNVVYIKATINVEIICRVEGHKPFSITPNNHLQGQGCRICGIKKRADKKRLSLEEFIEKANKVHGEGRYDYSKVVYVNGNIEVIITCPMHGDFPQTPNNHLQGQGCKICGYIKIANTQRKTKEEFIRESKEIHGNKYDYSKVNYINDATKVIIICKNCKKNNRPCEFEQKPNKHLNGQGCRICGIKNRANKRRMTLEEFIEKANKKHGFGRYDYSKVKYINAFTDVIIICHNHNKPCKFKQRPNNHLNGQGCPMCDESKGEIKIIDFLIYNNIKFEREKKFNNCKYKKHLSFDFYLPIYNLCIEFDGGQHFKPCGFGAKLTEEQLNENFKIIQLRDQIKNEYCKKNGIGLLRLNNLKTVEKELTEYFQTHKIIKEQNIFNL